MNTYYQILGVTPDSTPDDIRRAYLELAVVHHPDKGGDADKFAQVGTAYGVLKNPEFRSDYDVQLRLLRNVCGDCRGAGRKAFQTSFTTVQRQKCERCDGVGYL